MTDFLDEKRDEIEDRLAELRPLVEEYNRLQAAAAALRGIDGTGDAGAVESIPSPASLGMGAATGAGPQLGGEAPSAPAGGVALDTAASEVAVRRGPGRPRGGGGASIAGASGAGSGARAGESVGDNVSNSSVQDTGALGEDKTSTMAEQRASNGPRRAGRPKGSGTRAAEALRIVREHPGVTIPELADRMGIKQNYLYRVLPELVQEGKVAKQGRGWHPRAA